MTNDINITEDDVIGVLDTDEPKSRVRITIELGYDREICECCGQVTNDDEFSAALTTISSHLRSLHRRSRVSTSPGWEWLLDPSET